MVSPIFSTPITWGSFSFFQLRLSSFSLVRVRRKINYGGMIDKPITYLPNQRVSDLQHEIEKNRWTFTSFPIVNEEGHLLGLVTRDELDFVEESNPKLSEIMKPRSRTITTASGTNSTQAYEIMRRERVKKLPVVDEKDTLLGMYVWNDVKDDNEKKDLFSLDNEGHFLVGAAIGFGPDDLERADILINRGGCKVSLTFSRFNNLNSNILSLSSPLPLLSLSSPLLSHISNLLLISPSHQSQTTLWFAAVGFGFLTRSLQTSQRTNNSN
jgi:CBS domain-containing protein